MKILKNIANFFLDQVPASIPGHLNVPEIIRVVSAALGVGSGTYVLFEALRAVVGRSFPAPADAALAAVVLTLILEASRRLRHGEPLRRTSFRRCR